MQNSKQSISKPNTIEKDIHHGQVWFTQEIQVGQRTILVGFPRMQNVQ